MRAVTRQRAVYWALLLVCATAAGITVLSPLPASLAQVPPTNIPKPLLVAANFGLILVLYGLLGLLGLHLAARNSWPGVFKEGAGWRELVLRPLWLGAASGAFIIVGSRWFGLFHHLGPLPHPPFPFSLSASFAAGIGEELLMRLVLMSCWAWLLRRLFGRFQAKRFTDGMAVIIAAAIFGLAHLAGPVYLAGFKSLGDIPGIFIVEMLVLNGVLGILAGREMIANGFVAAVGIHFWADIVWHVLYGSLGSGA